MRLVNSSIFVIIVSALAAVAINNYSPNPSHNPTLASQYPNSSEKSYILQGGSAQYLRKIVDQVGGIVSQEFPFINAVNALLTSSQVTTIRKIDGVRVQDDLTVITSSVSKSVKKTRINNYIAQQTGANRLHDMNITGKGVTVAVVDSGTNMWGEIGSSLFRDSHNQIRAAVKYDAFKGHETYVYNDDQNGHGTHVSGLIASSYKDSEGHFNGIAPDVYLLSVKAFDSEGQSSYSKVLDSLNWVFENRYKYKIRVVNMSLGAQVQSYYWNDPINQAVMRLWDAGVVVVTSAGNNGKDMGITVPGNNPYVITVGGATDSGTPYDMTDDRLATFSSKGPTLEGFIKPEILSYATQISSRLDERYLRKSLKLSSQAQHYSQVSGTSQAAAIVTGVAALVISNDPYATPDEVKCRIIQTATAAQSNGNATYSPFEQGAGLVNAYAAVMSSATNCANTNLNIKQDLLGINHFVGPTIADVNGNIVIELPNGTTLSEDNDWIHPDLRANVKNWFAQDIRLNSSLLNHADQSLDNVYYRAEHIGLQGTFWNGQDLALQGANWKGPELTLKGMHWAGEVTQIQSSDLSIAPIDPNVVVPIVAQGWQ